MSDSTTERAAQVFTDAIPDLVDALDAARQSSQRMQKSMAVVEMRYASLAEAPDRRTMASALPLSVCIHAGALGLALPRANETPSLPSMAMALP